MPQDFKQLEIWKEAVNFHVFLMSKISKFPDEEKYAMGSQLRRAGLSISSNIAEGCGRRTQKELLSFLYIAMGSTKEVESILYVARELGYLPPMAFDELNKQIIIVGKRLNVFIQKINEKMNGVEN
jgi:four helix bundle protein